MRRLEREGANIWGFRKPRLQVDRVPRVITIGRLILTDKIMTKGVVIMAKYNRNSGKSWTKSDISQLRSLARENTPTRVIGLKLGRTEDSVRTKASETNTSLKPVNQRPYGSKK